MRLTPALVLLLPVLCLVGCARDLGVNNGRLSACPKSPNCVSSQANPEDKRHYMAPIPFEGTSEGARKRLVSIIKDMPRTSIEKSEKRYIHAVFRTLIFRFRDDVEFYVDTEEGLIHFRSASRIGYSDRGLNRKRMREIRDAFLSSDK